MDGTARRTREIGGKSDKKRGTRGIEKLGNRERKWEFWKEIGNGKTFILLVIQTLNLESVVWRTKARQSGIIYQKVLFKLINIKPLYVTDRRTDGQILK